MLLKVLGALLLCAVVTASEVEVSRIPQECRPSSCKGTWDSWGSPLTLACDVASGHLPLGLQLPLVFDGDFDLCMTFPEAKYCRVEYGTDPHGLPLFIPLKNHSVFPLGALRLGQCISSHCDVVGYKESFTKELEGFLDRVLTHIHVPEAKKEAIEKLVATVLDGVSIKCVEDPPKVDAVGMIPVVFICCCLGMFVVTTWLAMYSPSSSVVKKTPMSWFNGVRNFERLTASIPGDFNSLNGIRVISMCWVIIGHNVLLYSGQLMNPTLQGSVLQGYGFAYIRGAFFAVDTFFFMSGFLATWGLLKQYEKSKLTIGFYSKMMIARYLRLTPAYCLVVLVYWKVLPSLSSGPNYDGRFVDMCDTLFYKNMLYINNLGENSGTMKECAAWTWYLANDFQFFLLAPILSYMYLIGTRSSGFKARALKYGPTLTLIGIQLLSTFLTLRHFNYASALGNPGIDEWIYVKPWTRVTPYAIGVFLAGFHYERTNSDISWKNWSLGDAKVQLTYVAAILTLILAISLPYDQWRCKAGEHECQVWFSQGLYGFFVSENWSKFIIALYYTFSYLMWSLALAVICYVLFSKDEYDIFYVKQFLSHPIFTPLARLTYNAYLVHIPLMDVKMWTETFTPNWQHYRIALECIGYICLAYTLSFCIYMLVEKPVMNACATLMKGKRRSVELQPVQALERANSLVSDPDNEALHFARMHHSEDESANANAEDYQRLSTS